MNDPRQGPVGEPSGEPPPEKVRSTPGAGPSGPVPVRDLMRQMTPEAPQAPGAEADPRWDGVEKSFTVEDASWVARSAGAGAYGTGRRGVARLIAVHFFSADDLQTPVREALIPAGLFPHLAESELAALFERATPIELER